MKKLLLIASFLLSMIGYAQFQFPETEVNLILNKDLKVVSNDIYKITGYRNFYKSLDFNYKNELEKNFELLNGKTLKVTAIDKQDDSNYKLTLTNSEVGTVYYKYNSKFSFEFPFEIIGGITMPDGYYCSQLTTSTDKFTNVTTTMSKPFTGTYLLKTVNGKETKYMMLLSALSPTAAINKTGVTILLADGKKIVKPNAKIELDVNAKGGKDFKYTSLIELNKADLAMLTASPMTDARLYIFDTEYKEGIKMMETLKCLIK